MTTKRPGDTSAPKVELAGRAAGDDELAVAGVGELAADLYAADSLVRAQVHRLTRHPRAAGPKPTDEDRTVLA